MRQSRWFYAARRDARAGGLDQPGREALLKCILRPAVAQERITQSPDGLIRILLKKPFSDGTVAVDLDPLSLLGRLTVLEETPTFVPNLERAMLPSP